MRRYWGKKLGEGAKAGKWLVAKRHQRGGSVHVNERKEQGLRSVCPWQGTFPRADRHLHNATGSCSCCSQVTKYRGLPSRDPLRWHTLLEAQHHCHLEYFPETIHINLYYFNTTEYSYRPKNKAHIHQETQAKMKQRLLGASEQLP